MPISSEPLHFPVEAEAGVAEPAAVATTKVAVSVSVDRTMAIARDARDRAGPPIVLWARPPIRRVSMRNLCFENATTFPPVR